MQRPKYLSSPSPLKKEVKSRQLVQKRSRDAMYGILTRLCRRDCPCWTWSPHVMSRQNERANTTSSPSLHRFILNVPSSFSQPHFYASSVPTSGSSSDSTPLGHLHIQNALTYTRTLPTAMLVGRPGSEPTSRLSTKPGWRSLLAAWLSLMPPFHTSALMQAKCMSSFSLFSLEMVSILTPFIVVLYPLYEMAI